MDNIIGQYYRGITQRLRSEVDFINDLFHHQGVKGAGNEGVLRDLLTQFIPKRYGVGTGIVIDRDGNQSRHCDIVIYDTFLYPSLLSLTSVHLFPVDIVYATIEVKTTLTTKSAKEARENIASVRSLNIVPDTFNGAETQEGRFSFIEYTPDPPQGYVFAYNSNAQQCETFKSWFIPSDEQVLPYAPILVGCLDQGVLLFKFPDGTIGIRPEVGMQLKACILPLENEVGDPVELADFQEQYAHNGVSYPVKKVRNKNVVIDQSRTMLFFLLSLQEILSRKRINPNISFLNHYVYNLASRYEI